MRYKACEKCFEDLYSKDPGSAKFWLDLCDSHTAERYLYVELPGSSIQMLEHLGFLVSTDRGNNIYFRLLGQQSDYFCVDSTGHQETLIA